MDGGSRLLVAPGVDGDQDRESPQPTDEDGIEAPQSAVHSVDCGTAKAAEEHT